MRDRVKHNGAAALLQVQGPHRQAKLDHWLPNSVHAWRQRPYFRHAAARYANSLVSVVTATGRHMLWQAIAAETMAGGGSVAVGVEFFVVVAHPPSSSRRGARKSLSWSEPSIPGLQTPLGAFLTLSPGPASAAASIDCIRHARDGGAYLEAVLWHARLTIKQRRPSPAALNGTLGRNLHERESIVDS